MNSCSFYSTKKLYARIDDEKEEVFPYLTTVKELKEKFNKRDNNVGVVINGHFVFDDSNFLAQYLSSPNSEKSPIQIKIIRPDTDCRLCEIETGKKMRKRSFIIPTNYTFNHITTVYLEMKANSMQYFSGFKIEGSSLNSPLNNTENLKQSSSREFWADLTQNLVVNYSFGRDLKDYTIEMSNENNPQIKDLLLEISKKHNKQFRVYDAYIRHKRVDFWEFVVNIIDQKLEIKTYEYQPDRPENEKYLSVYDLRIDCILLRIKTDINNITVESIIKIVCDEKEETSNYSVYLNFHKLSLKDKPIILYQPYDFIFVTKNMPEKDICVSNGYGIEHKIKVGYNQNSFISTILLSEFNLKSADFILKIPDSLKLELKEFNLPVGFDAGNLPKNSAIQIRYNVQKANKFTFSYENDDSDDENELIQSTVTLSDPFKQIKYLKKEIIEKMKLFNIALKVVDFEFLGIKLNQNRTFSSYGITENSRIAIVCKKISIKVTVCLFNDFKLGNYFLEKESKVEDIIHMLKTKYKIDDPDYNLEIYSNIDKESFLDKIHPLKNEQILYASFEKVIIRLLEPNGESLEFDEIVRPTKKFMMKYIMPIIHYDDDNFHFVLYKSENKKHFIPVDLTKTFREIGDKQYFLFKRLFRIKFYFMDKKIFLGDELMISEYETVDYLIKYYLKDVILGPPQLIELYINGINVNKNETVKEIISEGKKVEIRLIETNSNEAKPIRKKPKINIKLYKPKVKSINDKKDVSDGEENFFNEKVDNKTLFIGEDDEQFYKIIEPIGEG